MKNQDTTINKSSEVVGGPTGVTYVDPETGEVGIQMTSWGRVDNNRIDDWALIFGPIYKSMWFWGVAGMLVVGIIGGTIEAYFSGEENLQTDLSGESEAFSSSADIIG